MFLKAFHHQHSLITIQCVNKSRLASVKTQSKFVYNRLKRFLQFVLWSMF